MLPQRRWKVERSSLKGLNLNINSKLSFEIIAYMFEFYVDHDELERSSTRSRRNGYTLGGVCRLWRRISWTSPPLWNFLCFALEKDTTKTEVELAIDWLKRSGGLPLTIIVRGSHHLLPNESLIFPLIDIVNKILGRCRHLGLMGLSSSTFSQFSFQIPQGSLIQTLRLSPTYLNQPLNFGIHAMPTTLSISNLHLDLLVINWSNLTHFWASGLYSKEILDALLLAPQIILCDQSRVQEKPNSVPPDQLRSLIHPRLAELRYWAHHEAPNDPVAAIFERTTFPSLRHCHIHSRSIFPTEIFMLFISRSYCAITTLDIWGSIITNEDLVTIARALPCIISLTLRHWSSAGGLQPPLDAFFNTLCQGSPNEEHNASPGNMVLLPSLRDLTVECFYQFHWELVLVLCNRHNNVGNLYTSMLAPAKMEKITIIRSSYVTDLTAVDPQLENIPYLPSDLIDDWYTFLALLELKDEVEVDLEAPDAEDFPDDLFDLSYRKLVGTSGMPPDNIRENDSFRMWRVTKKFHEDEDVEDGVDGWSLDE